MIRSFEMKVNIPNEQVLIMINLLNPLMQTWTHNSCKLQSTAVFPPILVEVQLIGCSVI